LDSIDNKQLTSQPKRIVQKDGSFSILASMYKYRDVKFPPLGAPFAPGQIACSYALDEANRT
jgi:hypothetical protein